MVLGGNFYRKKQENGKEKMHDLKDFLQGKPPANGYGYKIRNNPGSIGIL